jgi:hypothetical protein
MPTEVVVKVRPDLPRIPACVQVQRRMFQAGYPRPRPPTGATAFGADVATAEAFVPGGGMLPSAEHAAAAFAGAFARLIRLAPRPAEVSTLDPAPSWAAWNHGGDGLWIGPGRKCQRGPTGAGPVSRLDMMVCTRPPAPRSRAASRSGAGMGRCPADGKLLASANNTTNSGTVRLWDPATGHPIGAP